MRDHPPTGMTVDEFLYWDADDETAVVGNRWTANRC
jgi:hypothetical protein